MVYFLFYETSYAKCHRLYVILESFVLSFAPGSLVLWAGQEYAAFASSVFHEKWKHPLPEGNPRHHPSSTQMTECVTASVFARIYLDGLSIPLSFSLDEKPKYKKATHLSYLSWQSTS